MVREASRPSGRRFRAAGKRLWDSVLADYELEVHEEAMLTQACRTVDVLESLHRIIALQGPMQATETGSRAHPAVIEARQQRLAWQGCWRPSGCLRVMSRMLSPTGGLNAAPGYGASTR